MDIELKHFGQVKVAYVRHIGPYEKVSPAWGKLKQWAIENNLFTPETMFLGLCHDDPKKTSPENIRYDACMTIPYEVEGNDEVKTQTLVSGEYAVTLSKGPYKNAEKLWEDMFEKWLPQNVLKYKEGFPCIEKYLNNPEETPEEELLTELYMPVY